MKRVLPALFLLMVFLDACTRESITTPEAPALHSPSVYRTPVSYKDAHISIINLKAEKWNREEVNVAFTTLFEKDVVKLEVLRGISAVQLCSIYQIAKGKDSYSATLYTTSDMHEKSSPSLFYMVKYTLEDGNWGYTPVFQLDL